jgi:hypothetical protein
MIIFAQFSNFRFGRQANDMSAIRLFVVCFSTCFSSMVRNWFCFSALQLPEAFHLVHKFGVTIGTNSVPTVVLSRSRYQIKSLLTVVRSMVRFTAQKRHCGLGSWFITATWVALLFPVREWLMT